MAAWKSAKDLVSKNNKIRAEAKLTGHPRPVPSSERRAVERSFGDLEDKECRSTLSELVLCQVIVKPLLSAPDSLITTECRHAFMVLNFTPLTDDRH